MITDGLNGNVDIFSLEDFSYIDTLDISQGVLLSALSYKSMLYLGTESSELYSIMYQANAKHPFTQLSNEKLQGKVTQLMLFSQGLNKDFMLAV